MRRLLLAASRSPRLRRTIEGTPAVRAVRRFVPGTTVDDALAAAKELHNRGLLITLDHLGEDTVDRGQADLTVGAYTTLLRRLDDTGLTHAGAAEVSLKLSALGQLLDPALALDNARLICRAATTAGTTVTLDMEDHTMTDSTLDTLQQLRRDFPATGVALQAYLRRTEADCRDLAHAGSRVRLCKGAYKEPSSVAFQARSEVSASYRRCLRTLFEGHGYPMVATHDPKLIELARDLGQDRPARSFEFQMLFGVRPLEQARLVADGSAVRVYVPYGEEYYGYFMRRLAERPANTAFFLRALVGRS